MVLALPHAPNLVNDASVTADQVQAQHDPGESFNQIATLARKNQTLLNHEKESVKDFLSELTQKRQGIHHLL